MCCCAVALLLWPVAADALQDHNKKVASWNRLSDVLSDVGRRMLLWSLAAFRGLGVSFRSACPKSLQQLVDDNGICHDCDTCQRQSDT